jgi:lipoprotein-anchoring transpeptidase ErfK/SrfK
LRVRAWLPVAAAAITSTSVVFASVIFPTSASAQMLGYAETQSSLLSNGGAAISAEDGGLVQDDSEVLAPGLRRQVVGYATREAPGTVIIDTPNTVLYYVLGNNRAIRYGVGVGREGFTWSGTETISRKAEWPDWHPPAEMIARQPYLPRFMAGGPGNPLGARAIYLGSSMYRIHGTNDPSTIGKFVSSGCIRMTNADVEDLFRRVGIGTRVVVLPKSGGRIAARRGNPVQPAAEPATLRRQANYLPAPL